MKSHYNPLHQFQILIAALLLLLLSACESSDVQVAALATGQARQATEIADQATKAATDLQIAQLSIVQSQQATQIAGQAAQITSVDQIAQLMTLQAQQSTVQAQLIMQIEGQATRISDTSQSDQLSTMQAQQGTQIANQMDWISNLSTRVPPRVVIDNPTPTPYRPVDGSVTIEDGRCCAGGVAGETIDVSVTFGAFSPLAEVTEMRILSGGLQFDENDMIAADWQPFVTSTRLPIQVLLNWTNFNVSVQFRDAAGNLSRVSHDDVSIEGHPARPTP
jgi:hypothetical protein